MKQCDYCGKELDERAIHCTGCGTPTSQPVEGQGDPEVNRRLAHIRHVLFVVASVVGFVVISLVGAMWLVFRSPYPPQPKFGFKGDWRCYSVFGEEERRLPPAKEVWRDYEVWKPKTNEYSSRLYVARLGGAERQLHFTVSTNSGDTPMGAQKYTSVHFTYNDPTNGTYLINWTLRGKHDASFLQFDARYRLYQLQLWGEANEYPPKLTICGIEGIRPEHYSDRPPDRNRQQTPWSPIRPLACKC